MFSRILEVSQQMPTWPEGETLQGAIRDFAELDLAGIQLYQESLDEQRVTKLREVTAYFEAASAKTTVIGDEYERLPVFCDG